MFNKRIYFGVRQLWFMIFSGVIITLFNNYFANEAFLK